MTCPDCNGTGWWRRNMTVTPHPDDHVDYVVNLVACSHPKAPADGPSVVTQHRETAVVGQGVAVTSVSGDALAEQHDGGAA